MPVVAKVPTHIIASTAKAEVECVIVVTIVGHRNPIVAIIFNTVVRHIEIVARSRKKNTVAIWSGRFVTVYSSLGGLSPSAVID